MKGYDDLELAVLSCVLQKPKLMENTILKDKYFIKHKKIWIFLKAFYKRFKCFDLTLMYSISKNKYRIVEYIAWLIDQEATPSVFKQYEEELVNKFYEKKKDKYISEKIYELAMDLICRNISLEDFKSRLEKVYKNAELIMKDMEGKK